MRVDWESLVARGLGRVLSADWVQVQASGKKLRGIKSGSSASAMLAPKAGVTL